MFSGNRKCVWGGFVLGLFGALAVQAQVNVTTYHNDNARDGQNLNETILTPENVKTNFGRLFVQAVDGNVFAQPLYISSLQIAGGTHNVVFVATEHDSVYAFDADNNAGANASPLWHVSFINPAAGITTVDSQDDLSCSNISPEVGITGTPVIDTASNTLYVVAKTKENGEFFQRLHALDITTGAEKFGGPVVIQATVPGAGAGTSGGQVPFDPKMNNQRPGLMLLNGLVYVTWASHCDHTPYHGWMIAYNATTLQPFAVWNSTPNGSDGGVWQSGAAPSADASGNIFFATGNGTFNLNTGGVDAGDTILRFPPPTSAGFTVADYFTPYNQATLSADDTDVGSGGVVLLPDLPQGAAHPHLLVEMGKEGTLYLVDRDSMGKYKGGGDTQIVQWLPNLLGGLWATPAFWNNTLYIGAAQDSLQAFSLNANNSGVLSTVPVSASSETYSYPGTTPAISANGTSNAIVWALGKDNGSSLHAYDATNLSNELYNAGSNPLQTAGPAAGFPVPTIANGKVYVGAGGQIAVFGLLGPPPSAPTLVSPASGATGIQLQPSLIWNASNGATSYDVYFGTTSPPPLVINVPGTTYNRFVLGSNTVYYWMIAARNLAGATPSAIWSFTTGNFPAQIASPIPGSTLSGTLATFAWSPVSGATLYQLMVGSSLGGSNIFNATTTGTSETVNHIPCNGGTVYVQLAAQVNGSYLPATAYSYVCKSGIGDFNGDGFQDLLWQNTTTGQVNVHYYGGSGPQSQGSAVLDTGTSLAGWRLVGAADFDANGFPDLVYQNTQTGQVNVNYYGGAGGKAVISSTCLSCGIDTSTWQVVAVADYDGNGVPDLVYQNTQTHQVNVDYYGGKGGSSFIGWACLSCGIDTTVWQVKAAADFDGNGVPDLVYQNTQTGQVNVDYYGGPAKNSFIGWACLSCSINITGWQVVGAADWNADGVADLVYQNTQSGQVNVSYYGGPGGSTFEGSNSLSTGSLPASAWVVAKMTNQEPALLWQNNSTNAVTSNYYSLGGAVFEGWACASCGIDTTGWQLVGSGDFDGNGAPDLVYQNKQTHQVNVNYYSSPGGTTFIGWACLSCGIDVTSWQVVAVADFDGNGVPDLVYQNTQTHQVNVNYYGGTGGSSFLGWACLSCGIDVSSWQVKAAVDFDGNGAPDLVYQNTQTHQVNVDYYGGPGGAKFIGWACLSCTIDLTGWQLVGASDFDGNGVPDLVYQYTTGEVNVDYYGGPGGAVLKGWNVLSAAGYPGWSVVVPRSR